jgi:hypothetical protein
MVEIPGIPAVSLTAGNPAEASPRSETAVFPPIEGSILIAAMFCAPPKNSILARKEKLANISIANKYVKALQSIGTILTTFPID